MSTLLNVVTPVCLVPADTAVDTVFVKGFASVETIDRSKDYVPPEAFAIDQFMAAPTLLLNHQFWTDPYGNSVAIGKVTEAFPADITSKSADMWAVRNLRTSNIVNEFPKSKTPNLIEGTRGLFVVAEVIEPDVVKRVRAGELSAFSWRGFAEVSDPPPGSKALRKFSHIDLMEISLVHMPDNPDATFVIGKSAVDVSEPLTLYAVQLSKTHFDSPEVGRAFLTAHALKCDLLDQGQCFLALQDAQVDPEDLVRFSLQNGVTFVAGKQVKQPSRSEWRGNRASDNLSSEDLSQIIRLNTMADNSIAIEAGDGVTVIVGEKKKRAAKAASDNALPVKNKNQRAMKPGSTGNTTPDGLCNETGLVKETGLEKKTKTDEIATLVAEKTSAAVAAALGPVLQQLASVLGEVAKSSAVAEAPVAEAPTQEVEEVVEGEEEVVAETEEEVLEVATEQTEEQTEVASDDTTTVLAESLLTVMDELKSLREAFSKQTRTAASRAQATVRDETIEKSATRNSDANSVFDSVLFRQFGV